MAKPLHDNSCEEHVFSSLFKKHSKNLHDFLYYKFGAQLNPKDKVQEAFARDCAQLVTSLCLKGFSKFPGPSWSKKKLMHY